MEGRQRGGGEVAHLPPVSLLPGDLLLSLVQLAAHRLHPTIRLGNIREYLVSTNPTNSMRQSFCHQWISSSSFRFQDMAIRIFGHE